MATWGQTGLQWGAVTPVSTTYTDLLSDIASWLNRDDLTAVIPTFIRLAEADMNAKLRLRAMLTRATTTVSGDGYETVPSDFLQMYRLTLDAEEIQFMPAIQVTGYAARYLGESPLYYTILGDEIQFAPIGPTPGGSLEMTYYARPIALSATNLTNALLTANPALHLYGSLVHSAPFLGDDARVQVWGTLYNQALDAVQSADDAAEFPAPLVIRAGAWD